MLFRRARRLLDREGLWQAHLQVFLAVRDPQRRVALVQLDAHPGQWMLPSENCFDGQDPTQLVADIAPRWFRTPLPRPRLVQAQNYPPEDGDGHWMVVLVHEVDAPVPLEPTPDTTELRFFPPGEAVGPMFKDHATVWAKLPP